MNDARSIPGERRTVFLRAPIHDDAVALLKADPRLDVVTWDEARIENWRDEADAVILRGTNLTGDDIRSAKRLKVIGRARCWGRFGRHPGGPGARHRGAQHTIREFAVSG